MMQIDELPETTEFLTFVRTVEARSISRAARELGVPRPTVGRRLARLEEKLGVRLLRRTTRTMVLTDAGEALYARARGVIAAVRDAEASVRQSDDAVRGTLRVSAPPIQYAHFSAMIAAFVARYPDVRLELELTTRHVDFAAGGFDVALRAGSQLPPGLIARQLSRSLLVAVASPAYLARRSAPPDPEDLAAHDAVVFETPRGTVRPWSFAGRADVTPRPRLVADHGDALVWAAEDGAGIAQILDFMAEGALAAGRLVELFPDRRAEGPPLHALCLPRRHGTPRVRVGLEALEEVLGVRAR